jgi:hypothetical protein
LTVALATHRLEATGLLLHPTSTASEIESHLRVAKCRVIFTCAPLLQTALQATTELGIPPSQIFLLDLPIPIDNPALKAFQTVDQLVSSGKDLAAVERAIWRQGQGIAQTAFLAASSGTSGFQVGHRDIHGFVIVF